MDRVAIRRQTARVLPDFARDTIITVPFFQARLMGGVAAVNNRAEGYPTEMLSAELFQVQESAKEFEEAIKGAAELGVAVLSGCSGYTGHDRLVAQYGTRTWADEVDALRFTAEDVTGVIVQPRHGIGDIFDPQINLRVKSDHDPLLSVRGDDGCFMQVPSPGRWYKFPLDAVLVAGMGNRETGQQI